MRPIGQRWRELREDLDLDVEHVALQLRIAPGSLKNIESNQPKAVVSPRLAKRAAKFFGVPLAEVVLPAAERVPDEPPAKKQLPEKNTGPGRKEEADAPKGPKRLTDGAAA